MKTMGKFGLCTVESYIGGEFFESNYLDTDEPKLKAYFPNIHASVGGAQFADIAASTTEWHHKALTVKTEADIPFLGLFKERQEGAGHTFGNTAVREYINMTDEAILYIPQQQAPTAKDAAYLDFGYEKRTPEQIDSFGITPAYSAYTTYDEVYYIADAIKRAGSTDPDKLVTALEATSFVGTIGKVEFYGRDSEFTHAIKVSPEYIGGMLVQWQAGKQVTIWPSEIANAKISFPAFIKTGATN